MIEDSLSKLVDTWGGPAGVPADPKRQQQFRRAIRSAFEVGVAAHANRIVPAMRDAAGQLLPPDAVAAQSDTLRWNCSGGPGNYFLKLKAWKPGSDGQTRERAEVFITFGDDDMTDAILSRRAQWHTEGVELGLPLDADYSTYIQVVTQGTGGACVELECRFGDQHLAPTLSVALEKNQATRRWLDFDLP